LQAKRAYLTIGSSTSAKPNGCELIEEKYADIGSARRIDVSSLIGIPCLIGIPSYFRFSKLTA
jgi:hypothetical protein